MYAPSFKKPTLSTPSRTGITFLTFQLRASQRIAVLSLLAETSTFSAEEKPKRRTTDTWESSVDIALRFSRSHIRILPSSLPDARRNDAVKPLPSLPTSSMSSSCIGLLFRRCFLLCFAEMPVSIIDPVASKK